MYSLFLQITQILCCKSTKPNPSIQFVGSYAPVEVFLIGVKQTNWRLCFQILFHTQQTLRLQRRMSSWRHLVIHLTLRDWILLETNYKFVNVHEYFGYCMAHVKNVNLIVIFVQKICEILILQTHKTFDFLSLN